METPADDRFDPALLAELRLASVSGVGPRLRVRLIEALGSARAALGACAADLRRVDGVGPVLAQAIAAAPDDASAASMLAEGLAAGIRPLLVDGGEYPDALREIADPPPVLYCKGNVLAEDARAVAIVGTRRATRYGLQQAERIAGDLARAGVTVVSGLARGIDAAAHRGAMAAGGRTLAVLAGGLLRIYPPEHRGLADEVARQGALLAESPPRMPPMSGSFPQRNRVISGLSRVVVVIEAAERSGALITARHAAEQGRDAMALPGPVDSPQSRGCHLLIQEGAKLVRHADDVLDELDGLPLAERLIAAERKAEGRHAPRSVPDAGRREAPRVLFATTRDLSEVERAVLAAVTDAPTTIDAIIDATDLPAERVLAALMLLETGGELRRLSGAVVARR
ncbi:MAG: DNA-processing protein DprA [Lacipirellulaceae bacterium]